MPRIIILIIALLITIKGHSSVIEMCQSCVITTLEDAIQKVNKCDTILIDGGEYHIENVFIDKSLTIIGSNQATLISKSGDELLTITADYVTIKGLILKNVTMSYIKERAAIRAVKQKYITIENNFIKDCFFAIYLENSHFGNINNNIIEGNATTEAESGNGIHAWYCKNINISNNNIKGHRDGIYFEFVDKSKITNNHSELNTRYGLHFMFSNDDDYWSNTFKNNGVGVAVMFSSRITMLNNQFIYNWGRASYGLLLKEINDAQIIGNMLKENTIGIYIEGSNRVKYSNNTFDHNGWAIKFSGGSSDNDFTRNNFINNSLDLIVNTKLGSNILHHNYWSNYSGYDLDRDRIGDVPYYPVKLFSYILDQAPEAIVLMRSLFVDLINFSERVSPVFTPKEVMDDYPIMDIIR